MPPFLTLVLAFAPLVVGYLAWRHRRPGGDTNRNRKQPTGDQGERTVSLKVVGPDLERVQQWLEDAPTVIGNVCRILHEYDQAVQAARAAENERDRLEQQCAALRKEVRCLHADVRRLEKTRVEAVQWFTTVMREAAARFPHVPPPV